MGDAESSLGSVLSAETRATLAAMPGHKLNLLLAVDVGGTHTRVGLASPNRTSVYTNDKLKIGSHAMLVATFTRLAEELRSAVPNQKQINIVASCIAAAGPVLDGGRRVVVTNYSDSKTFNDGRGLSVSELPTEIFPKRQTCIINDLAGLCEGVVALADTGRIFEVFRKMWDGSDRSNLQTGTVPLGTNRHERNSSGAEIDPEAKLGLANFNYLVLAIGTGLGCGALLARVDLQTGNLEHRVLALEFGHTHITPLGCEHKDFEEDRQLLDYLSVTLWNGVQPPEWEDVCSGRGLLNCYRFLARDSKADDSQLCEPSAVAEAASSASDSRAVSAMKLHYRYLLRFAQQLCIGLQAKGVFLAGDNQISNKPFFWTSEDDTSEQVSAAVNELREHFESHQKGGWLKPAAVWGQVQPINLNINGCLSVAAKLRVT